ncbi:hypothetical protein BC629DRAFT_1721567 [Irpex lacteus]|nr:hypothetical protein BC629DRAFT_1721567 [Irpex lacteus]
MRTPIYTAQHVPHDCLGVDPRFIIRVSFKVVALQGNWIYTAQGDAPSPYSFSLLYSAGNPNASALPHPLTPCPSTVDTWNVPHLTGVTTRLMHHRTASTFPLSRVVSSSHEARSNEGRRGMTRGNLELYRNPEDLGAIVFFTRQGSGPRCIKELATRYSTYVREPPESTVYHKPHIDSNLLRASLLDMKNTTPRNTICPSSNIDPVHLRPAQSHNRRFTSSLHSVYNHTGDLGTPRDEARALVAHASKFSHFASSTYHPHSHRARYFSAGTRHGQVRSCFVIGDSRISLRKSRFGLASTYRH